MGIKSILFGHNQNCITLTTNKVTHKMLLVDTTKKDFFDRVLLSSSKNEDIRNLIDDVRKVQEKELTPFYSPTQDAIITPSCDANNYVPIEFNSFASLPINNACLRYWKGIAVELSYFKNEKWTVGNEDQWYAFLVQIVNNLVDNGWPIQKALEAVATNSLKKWRTVKTMKENFAKSTGCFNLTSSRKVLSCSNSDNEDLCWITGVYEFNAPALANLTYCETNNKAYDSCLLPPFSPCSGWLVRS